MPSFELPTVDRLSDIPTQLKDAWLATSFGDQLFSAGASLLLFTAVLSAFSNERPPARLSAYSAIALALCTAGAYTEGMNFSAVELGAEGTLYGIAALRGSGDTGKNKA